MRYTDLAKELEDTYFDTVDFDADQNCNADAIINVLEFLTDIFVVLGDHLPHIIGMRPFTCRYICHIHPKRTSPRPYTR